MMRLFKKLMPVLAIVGLAAATFAVIRGKKAGDIMGALKALFTSMLIVTLGAYAIYDLTIGNPGPMMFAVVWGSVGASTTGTFSFNFVPQFLEIIAATSPSLIQVNVNGDGMIFNLDTNGLSSMTHIGAMQRQTNSFLYQLADGLLNNKNGTVTVTTGASAVTLRVWSPIKRGTLYCTFNPAQALANQAYNLNTFSYASFPSAATTDSYQLSYNDGSLDNVTREELNVYLGYYQNDTITTAKYSVDNRRPARISQVTFTPGSAQTFYVMKYQGASGDPINANPNV